MNPADWSNRLDWTVLCGVDQSGGLAARLGIPADWKNAFDNFSETIKLSDFNPAD